ncbi:MAG: uracil-DNA glycosylase [Desulfatiglandales bacterium]
MEKADLSPDEELRAIVCHLKRLLAFDREMGLEAPGLSPSTRTYLEKGPSGDETLESLEKCLRACARCKLSGGRTNIVFGEGSAGAGLVFVGEAPGKEEDQAGRPFVGEAGRLLTRIIQDGMGLKREEVYICNVVKCRPPENRDPERDEIETCLPFLKRQLALIRPQVICTLGRIAAQALIGGDFRITRERGKWFTYMGVPVMPTFHPAYILRNPGRELELKRQVWVDIQNIMKRMGLETKGNA